MRTDSHPSQPAQPFASAGDAFGASDTSVTFYVTRSALSALQREAQAARASDWRVHAQRKLDKALAQQALPLTSEQAEALRQYADTLDLEPQALLYMLLAPGVARRERWLRQSLAFVRAHVPRRRSGCLMLAVWFAAAVGVCNLAAWALSLAPLLLHH